MRKKELVQCDNCGFEEARIRRVSRSYGEGHELLVVEGVPIVSCPKCGESYMTAATLHELQRLKEHRHDLAEDREVEVVRFSGTSTVA
jgi:YgiT-type zinc finger domain-containing protein